jgi:uncharacterized membrane protein YoaK (UPF0700 family)
VNAAPTAPPARVMTAVAIVLTFASGASDVASFTRLGNVFTSVMTGNITLFGLSLARGSVSLAAHTAVAFAGYVTGVVIGTRIAWHYSRRRPAGLAGPAGPAGPAAKPPGGGWPPHMTLTLLTELTLLLGVLAGWELTGTRPTGGAQFVILVAAACAMGIQSAAVNQMGLGNVSTTFLTGTLTGLVSAIARPGSNPGARRTGVLAGLVTGAVLAGALDAAAAALVPLLPVFGVSAAVALGSGLLRPGWLDPGTPADPTDPTPPAGIRHGP